MITGYSQGSQYAALFDTLAEPEFTDERIYANLAATPVGRRPAKSTPSSYTTVREDGVINNPSTLAPFGGVSFDRLPRNCTNIQNSIWPWLPQGHSWGFYMKPDRPGTWPSTRKLLETVAAVYAFGTNPLSPDHCDREPTDVAITDDGRQIPILEGVDPALLNEFGDDGVLPAARGLMMNVFAYDGETGAPLVIDQLNRGAGASVGAFGGATRAHFAADEIDGGDPLTMAVRRVGGDGEVAQRLTVESDRLYCAQMLSVSEYMPSAPYAPTTAFSFAIKPNIFAARHAASKIDYAPVKRGADRDADGPPLPEAITPVVTVRHAYDRRHHGACVDGRNENGWIATCVRAEDRIVFVDHTKTFAKGFLSGNESIDVSVSVRETADGFVPFFNQTSYSVPVEKDELLVYKPTPDGIKVLDWPPKPKPPHKPKSKPPLDDAQPEPEPEPVAGEPDVGPDDAPVQCPFRPFPEQYCEEVSYADPSRQVGAWDGPVAFTDGPYGAPMIQCCNQVEREGAFSSLRRKQQVCDVYRYDPFWCGRTSQPWRRVPGPGSPDIDWVRRTSPASTPGY